MAFGVFSWIRHDYAETIVIAGNYTGDGITGFFESILAYLAGGSTEDELAHQLRYLKIENEILRSKLPKRISITPFERNRLLHFGKLVGAAIGQLITIVTVRTFQRWLQAERGDAPRKPVAKTGLPNTDDETRERVLRLARDSHWGNIRILGELRKLGVTISRSNVVNILRNAGIDPHPERSRGTWRESLARHISTLWASDFFAKRIWTTFGLVDCFVLFFIHLESRRVIVTGMTTNPDAAWVLQQARTFIEITDPGPDRATHLLHDFDTKFPRASTRSSQATGSSRSGSGRRNRT